MERRTILVVEDEPVLREDIAEELKELADNVLQAANGEEALKLIRTNSVDAILSDIAMPKMTGLELLFEVRKAGYETPFVILSAFSDRPNLLTALRLGATDFLDKPFRIEVLAEVMKKALKLGGEIKSMERMLDKMRAQLEIDPEQASKFKKGWLAINIMGRDMDIYSSKKS